MLQVKESRADLADAREAAAESSAKLSSYAKHNAVLQSKLETLESEVCEA